MSEDAKKAAHTPGPWRAEGRGPNLIVVFVGEPDPNVSRNAVCAIMDGYAKEREANARLIAAAPEMYAALQCAANVLFLLNDEVAALGCNAKNVQGKIAAALASAEPAPDPADTERFMAQREGMR